jgi:ribonuclease HI
MKYIECYTDGSVYNGDGYDNARAGYAVWFGNGSRYNRSGRVKLSWSQSSLVAELMGLAIALKQCLRITETYNGNCVFIINSDSKLALKLIRGDFKPRIVETIRLTELCNDYIAQIKSYYDEVYLHYVKGHTGEYGNEMADRMAAKAASRGVYY